MYDMLGENTFYSSTKYVLNTANAVPGGGRCSTVECEQCVYIVFSIAAMNRFFNYPVFGGM